jgi:hypothetical protein
MQREVVERNQGIATGPTMTPNQPRDVPLSALFPAEVARNLAAEWAQIQAGFVDDPRTAVGRASELVARAVGALTTEFDRERGELEQQWGRGEDASTGDLRVALQRYRSFFQRLLSM